jgi:hypothetical protein
MFPSILLPWWLCALCALGAYPLAGILLYSWHLIKFCCLNVPVTGHLTPGLVAYVMYKAVELGLATFATGGFPVVDPDTNERKDMYPLIFLAFLTIYSIVLFSRRILRQFR